MVYSIWTNWGMMTNPKLTPLGVMLLALLREGDMHPYEMMRLLRARERDRLLNVTNGTLYHTVARLLEHGLLEEIGVDRDGNRPERTTYSLTERGDASMVAWVCEQLPRVDRATDFRVALAEAHNLSREDTLTLLTQRQSALAESLTRAEQALDAATAAHAPMQYVIEIERTAAMRHADLQWLQTLLQRLADPAFPWGPGASPQTEHYLQLRKAARQ